MNVRFVSGDMGLIRPIGWLLVARIFGRVLVY